MGGVPGPLRRPAYYVEVALRAIPQLLEVEHAVVWGEVEAKLADEAWGAAGMPIDPHHLSTARRELLADGTIAEQTAATKGGRPVSVFVLTGARRTKRATEAAAARKRLLQTRYLSWAGGTQLSPGTIGPAGERATHASLLAVAPKAGYRVFNPATGQVTHLFGEEVPGGPLDNGATLALVDADGVPKGGVIVPIEVKNMREWMYPNSPELYQLLYKAAMLQRARPDQSFTPVLVCRRAHVTLFQMASDLGFFVAEARSQFILPPPDDEGRRLLEEVRTELAYDLLPRIEVHRGLARRFGVVLPRYVESSPARWARIAEPLASHFSALRTPSFQPSRARAVDDLRLAARVELGGIRPW